MPIRLDKLVAETYQLSRRAAQEAILNGRVDLAGARCDEPGRLVEPDAPIAHNPNRPKARRVRTALRVLHEDRHVLIVDKPTGLLTLPTAMGELDTLRHQVERYLTIRHGQRPYVGIIHRLDKDTSGAIVLAKSPEALQAFQELFKAHRVERRYTVVVEGMVAREQGIIDQPIRSDPGEVRRKIAREPGQGRPAVTRYRVLEHYGEQATLLACWLETGRTHQIRVHLAGLGHPVVGDSVYRPRGRPRGTVRFRRQALHAQTLGFRHPLTDVEVRVEAPTPSDLSSLVARLRDRHGVSGGAF